MKRTSNPFFTSRMILLLLFFLSPSIVHASPIFCGLENPKTDIQRFFPNAFRFRIRNLVVNSNQNHQFYLIYSKDRLIGLIFGNCTPSMEMFIGYEVGRIKKIKDIYFQKIDLSDAEHFRSKFYRDQFLKFSVENLPDYKTVLPPRRSPTRETLERHQAVLNLVKSNAKQVQGFFNLVSQDLNETIQEIKSHN